MKKHTYTDGSVSYYYQIGDKVKFKRDYQGLIKQGTIAIICELGGAYRDDKCLKHIKAAGITSFVSVNVLGTYKGKKFWGYKVNVPVWELRPRNAKMAHEIPMKTYNKLEE